MKAQGSEGKSRIAWPYRRVYAPIDTFGKMYMHADPWHTNAAGNDLIAKAVLEKLKNDEQVQRYLAQLKAVSR